MNDQKILALIPARSGSKGVLKKNIRPLNGKPLIEWTVEAAEKSQLINKICISTDDEAIINLYEDKPVDVIRRPAEIAGDTSSTMEAVFHVLESYKQKQYFPDFVVLLQCTSPFRETKNIDEAIKIMLENAGKVNSVVSVMENDFPYQWLKQINDNGYLTNAFEYDKEKYPRRQDFDVLYKPNGAIYISDVKTLTEKKDFVTDKTFPYIMDAKNSLDIDTEWDFLCAQALWPLIKK